MISFFHRLTLSLRRLAVLAALSLTIAACSSRVELLSSLPENDANDILAVLLDAGVSADKRSAKDGFVVRVAPDQIAQAMSALHAQGLPRDPYVSFGQVFRKDGLISSPLEERARYLYALSQELAFTLTKIDGVVTARVHVVLPERIGRDDTMAPSSAAVFVKYRDDVALDTLQPQLRKLVVNSIPGLSADKVSFILVPVATNTSAARARPPKTTDALDWQMGGALLVALIAIVSAIFMLWRYEGDRLKALLSRRLSSRRRPPTTKH
ncbi:EscJ/YscJ/HrcJ family type III secretion inner membrane ring protein [Pandoraea iniqua]|uniref:Lipoprotein n=1 Tax=Pandoraea iniqua TaxID=2508288 RepID=A0A5E4YHL1_9BURK|nr:type III secretion inner membrane ring lipoprotein SctJ [Pandoraea iniqua]VVE48326.1 EscJ/YscJ/HrcJ family type III secretion inner membrane ring protein [Pandoraea iniqua]